MKLLNVRTRILLTVCAVAGISVLSWSESTGWPQLEAVTLDGADLSDWPKRFPLEQNKPLLEQHIDSVAAQLLANGQIGRVDIAYSLPHRLSIETNRFEPLALLLDQSSGEFRGIDQEGRVLPLEDAEVKWDVPVLTSVSSQGLFVECNDLRVSVVMPQLGKLADDAPGFFKLISEIDFGPDEFLYVTVSGMPYRLKIEAADAYEQLIAFIHFIECYSPETDKVEKFDLRFPGIIVCEGNKG